MKRFVSLVVVVGVASAGLNGCRKSEKSGSGAKSSSANRNQQAGNDNRRNRNRVFPGIDNLPGIGFGNDRAGRGAEAEPGKAGAQAQAATNPPEPKFREIRVAGKRGIVGVMTDRVVDYKVAIRRNPKLRIIEKPGGRGGDPITVLASTYVNAASRISRLNFAHNLKIMAALNGGRYPTYKQYIDTKNKMRVDLAKLPRGQVYAYREEKGDLVVLEDPAKSGKIGD